MRRQLHPGDDEGAILILALLFITVIGLLVMAILTTTTTVSRGAGVKRDINAKASAADAGLQYGLQQVRTRSNVCPSDATSGLLNPPSGFISGVQSGTSKNIEVHVGCTVTTDNLLGSSGYALVTRDSSTSNATTQGPNGAQLSVNGPVYLSGNPGASTATGQGNLSFAMTNGDFVMAPQSGTCPPVPKNVSLAGAPYVYACSAAAPAAPAGMLPSASWLSSATARTMSPSAKPAANCAVFLPGKYGSSTGPQQTLKLLDQNYFVSGVYYFDNVLLDLDKRILVGGKATTDEISDDDNSGDPLVTPCSNDANNKSLYDPGTTTGVKIVLGGNSAVIANNPYGQIEFFSRQGGDATAEGLQGVSVMTVPTAANGFDQSSLGTGDYALAVGQPSGGGGSTTTLVVHGFVYTPNATLQVRDNKIPARFFAGIDTGRLDIGTSNNVSGFAISVSSKPKIKTYRLQVVACGTSGAATMPDGSAVTCTAGYDSGQNVLATVDLDVNNTAKSVAARNYHVGPN